MASLLKIVAVVLVLAVAAVLVIAATKPDTLRVQRSIVVNAPATAIFPLIDDLHRWREWSPYETKDPAMTRSFAGSDRGRGAVYAWDGDRNVGAGRMEIVESTPPTKIVIDLQFFKPLAARNIAVFTLNATTTGTEVEWAMQGPAPFVSKLMQVFFNMDRMIGDDFEMGLDNLKHAAEKVAAATQT